MSQRHDVPQDTSPFRGAAPRTQRHFGGPWPPRGHCAAGAATMGGGGVQPTLLVGTTNRHPSRMVATRATCRRHGSGAARPGGEAARWGERSASSAENGRATLV